MFLSLPEMTEGKEETKELEVFNFTGAGGVALSMYNTDEVYTKQPKPFWLTCQFQFEDALTWFNLLNSFCCLPGWLYSPYMRSAMHQ